MKITREKFTVQSSVYCGRKQLKGINTKRQRSLEVPKIGENKDIIFKDYSYVKFEESV